MYQKVNLGFVSKSLIAAKSKIVLHKKRNTDLSKLKG